MPKNARYTSKTIQNEILNVYACKVKERLTKPLRDNDLPFTIIADEVTDVHANQEILGVCLRFVDLSVPEVPHIRECLVSFMYLERATSSAISSKMLESLSHTSLSLDPSNIRGQAYDGAAVMSSSIAGVQAKIKEKSSLHGFVYALLLPLSKFVCCCIL